MSGNTFGTLFRVTTWGESHGRGVGAVVDGCPAGLPLDEDAVQKELDRRKPGQSAISTQRQEEDRVEILSGTFEGTTTGTPISMMIRNKDAKSGAYDDLKDKPRPGHADYTYHARYGIRDHRGGGRSSGRETAGRVAAGAIAKKFLVQNGINLAGYVVELGSVVAKVPSEDLSSSSSLFRLKEMTEANPVRCPDPIAAERMVASLDRARKEGDSLGGAAEILAVGVPPGLGEPVFDKLDADLAKALMSVGAVKAVEIGVGTRCARMRGREMNDPLLPARCDHISSSSHPDPIPPDFSGAQPGEKGVQFETNNAGGILGGISTGAPILCRISVKPTPSISAPQKTVDLSTGAETTIEIKGRHDPSIPPRIVPVAESMVALVLADHLLRFRAARV